MNPETKLSWQSRLHEVIYESGTRAGRIFDVSLLLLIFTSIIIVMLDSDAEWHRLYGHLFLKFEIAITCLFTIEYILRLICIRKPFSYVFSFFGIIDLLSVVSGYLSIFYAGAQSLLVLRSLRLLRIFRIFKLSLYLSEMKFLGGAIRGSIRKISIFMLVVLTLVIIFGSVMYLVEGGMNGFNSIPQSIYWAIVTITTVGYGDISPVTALGKFVASVIMLMGYAIIAVPTGIITTEMTQALRNSKDNHQACPNCGREGHDLNARYCKFCGSQL